MRCFTREVATNSTKVRDGVGVVCDLVPSFHGTLTIAGCGLQDVDIGPGRSGLACRVLDGVPIDRGGRAAGKMLDWRVVACAVVVAHIGTSSLRKKGLVSRARRWPARDNDHDLGDVADGEREGRILLDWRATLMVDLVVASGVLRLEYKGAMEMEPNRTKPRGLSAGATIGGAIGVFGWWLGLCVVLLAAGRGDLMLELLPEGFLLTLGLCTALFLGLRLILNVAPPGSRLFQLGLWTGMLLTVGVLLLYCRGSVLPALLADPGISKILGHTGSVTAISPLVSGGVLLAGSVLGVLTLRELRRPHEFAA